MKSSLKQSALMFLTIFLFHCCNAKWIIVETQEGDGNEVKTEDNQDVDDKKSEEGGDELPDDLHLLNDDLELGSGSLEDGGMGTENNGGGNQGYRDLRHPDENKFLSLI